MTLTPAGEYLKERLLFAQSYLRESIQEANRIQTGISGSIRIGILEWATNVLLLPLQEFVKNNPQISVDIHCQQFQESRAAQIFHNFLVELQTLLNKAVMTAGDLHSFPTRRSSDLWNMTTSVF